jgi:hypothetical protein
MIERLIGFPDNVLAFVCRERVKRQDYETVLIPAVEAALADHDRMRLYHQTDRDFAGIDVGPSWKTPEWASRI